MADGTVTRTLTEYHQELAQRQAVEKELADAKAALIEARSFDPSGKLKEITEGFSFALDVVRFAVANLPAESFKGWPFKSLREVAKVIRKLPNAADNERDLATEIERFAGEVVQNEIRRARALNAGLPVDLVETPAILRDLEGNEITHDDRASDDLDRPNPYTAND